jgi:hypothetical protein
MRRQGTEIMGKCRFTNPTIPVIQDLNRIPVAGSWKGKTGVFPDPIVSFPEFPAIMAQNAAIAIFENLPSVGKGPAENRSGNRDFLPDFN